MKGQQINHRTRLCQYYNYLLNNAESDEPILNMKIIENPPEAEDHIHHRARLFHYYRYLLDRAPQEDDLKQMKIITSTNTTKQHSLLNKKNSYEQTSQTQDSSKKSTLSPQKIKKTKKLPYKACSVISQQDRNNIKLKLPSIRKNPHSIDNQKQDRDTIDHQLQTIKIDELTLKLIEQNQRKKLYKHRQSNSIQIKQTI